MLYERGSCAVSKWANACCRHGKKCVRDLKLVYERPVGWSIYRSLGMYRSEGRYYRGCRRLLIGGR